MKIKIVIQINDDNYLHEINTSEPISMTIKNICQAYKLNNPSQYGLKLLETNDGSLINHYVYEDNIRILSNGFKLLLTQSITEKVNSIFRALKAIAYTNTDTYVSELINLSGDLAFIKEILKLEKEIDLLELIVQDGVDSKEMFAYLKVLLAILNQKSIISLNANVIAKITGIIEECLPEKQLIAALAVTTQILKMKSKTYDDAKQQILVTLTVNSVLMSVKIKSASLNTNNLKLNAISLINIMARLLKGDLQMRFIKLMNNCESKGLIYANCIENVCDIDKDLAKALNVYQTLALSHMVEKKLVYINTKRLAAKEEVNSLRHSLISMDDSGFVKVINDDDDRAEFDREYPNPRMSIASVFSLESDATCLSYLPEFEPNRISALTNECIEHFEQNHNKNYQQAVASDKNLGIDFLSTAERMTDILTKIFRIGYLPTQSEFFYPIFFQKTLSAFFFQELFCRSFWLLMKTKREMNVATKEDYDVVFKVFEFQLGSVLRKKATDYKKLTEHMKQTSYQQISSQIQKEKELEFKYTVTNHPCVKDIKPRLIEENQHLIFEQRMNALIKGDFFLNYQQKKHARIFIHLNKSMHVFTWGLLDETYNEKKLIEPKSFTVPEIEYLIVGEACPHIRDNRVKKTDTNFALTLKANNETINLLAQNETTANYWIDGIRLLTGKPDRSKNYENELRELVEMDLHLNLIEIQNYKLSAKPPIVPPEPDSLPF